MRTRFLDRLSCQPLRALAEISRLLHQQERVLPAGSLILAGAATAAEASAAVPRIVAALRAGRIPDADHPAALAAIARLAPEGRAA